MAETVAYGLEHVDSVPLVIDDADPTKELRIEVSAIASGTERVWTAPNQNLDFTPGSGDFATAGPIDGIVIGGTTPANGSFLDLKAFSSDLAKDVTISHDGASGIIDTSSGALKMSPNSGSVIFGRNDNFSVTFEDGAGPGMGGLRLNKTMGQFVISSRDSAGNQFVFCEYTLNVKDFDHALQTDPTIFLHSDTDPDSANDEWMSFSHDKADANFGIGKGDYIFGSSQNGAALGLKTVSTEVTSMSGATVTASNLIPAGSFIVGVTIRVTTEITGATTFTIGDGSDATRWGTGIALAAGTTTDIADFVADGFGQFASANNVVLTATGSAFTAGAVRIVVNYFNLTAATS